MIPINNIRINQEYITSIFRLSDERGLKKRRKLILGGIVSFTVPYSEDNLNEFLRESNVELRALEILKIENYNKGYGTGERFAKTYTFLLDTDRKLCVLEDENFYSLETNERLTTSFYLITEESKIKEIIDESKNTWVKQIGKKYLPNTNF